MVFRSTGGVLRVRVEIYIEVRINVGALLQGFVSLLRGAAIFLRNLFANGEYVGCHGILLHLSSRNLVLITSSSALPTPWSGKVIPIVSYILSFLVAVQRMLRLG